MFLHEREQRIGVSGAADDLVPVVLEQPREALAQEHRVPAITTRTAARRRSGFPARGAVDSQAAALRGDAIGHAGQARAGVGAAPPTPSSVTTSRRARPVRLVRTVTCDGEPCLTALVTASQAMKYAAASTSGGARSPDASTATGTAAPRARSSSAAASPSSRRGDGRRPRSCAGRRSWPPPRRPPRRSSGPGPSPRGQRALDPAQRDPERHEALLGSVVQVALKPPPLRVPGLRDPRARGLDLGQLQTQSTRSRPSSTATAAASRTPRRRSGRRASTGSCSSMPSSRIDVRARPSAGTAWTQPPDDVGERAGLRQAEQHLGRGSASATASTAPTSSGSACPSRTSSRKPRTRRMPSKRARANRRSTVC